VCRACTASGQACRPWDGAALTKTAYFRKLNDEERREPLAGLPRTAGISLAPGRFPASTRRKPCKTTTTPAPVNCQSRRPVKPLQFRQASLSFLNRSDILATKCRRQAPSCFTLAMDGAFGVHIAHPETDLQSPVVFFLNALFVEIITDAEGRLGVWRSHHFAASTGSPG
jgi:hypothetical protein